MVDVMKQQDDVQPSRAELKRRMDRLQDLGHQLVKLPQGKLARIELPDELRRAVVEAQRLTSMEAIRRQVQYIGRIMEEFDAPSIARALRDVDTVSSRPTAQIKESSNLSVAEELLRGGDARLHEIYGDRYHHDDLQRVRTCMRQVAKAIAGGGRPDAELLKLAKVCGRVLGV